MAEKDPSIIQGEVIADILSSSTTIQEPQPTSETTPLPPAIDQITWDPTTTRLAVTIDFTSFSSSWYLTSTFETYRSSLLDTLALYPSLHPTTIIIRITLSHYRSQSHSIQRGQREILRRIVETLQKFHYDVYEKEGGNGGEEEGQVAEVKKLDIVFKAPEMHWSQIQGLAPFWGLKGNRWRVFLKTGENKAVLVKAGDEWERRLRAELRVLREEWKYEI